MAVALPRLVRLVARSLASRWTMETSLNMKNETYSWRGTPILQIIYNHECPPERWGTDYITLTRLV